MRPKATADLFVAAGWKQVCAISGPWSKGWILVVPCAGCFCAVPSLHLYAAAWKRPSSNAAR